MPTDPLVSIIVPVYNREKTLETSIRSIQNQKYSNWSLLIVNDNSTDKTPQIIKRLAEEDPRIHSILNTDYSHSCAGARLSGIDCIEGKYTAFLDSDDTWPDYHLDEFVTYLEAHDNVDYIFGDIQREDIDGNILTPSKFVDEKGLPSDINITWNGEIGILDDKDILCKSIRSRFNTGMQTSLFRSNFFDRIILKDVYGCEDALLTLEAVASEMRIAVSKKIHLNYLVHDDNISGANAEIDFHHALKNCTAEIKLLTEYIPKYINLDRSSKSALSTKLADTYVWHLGNSIYRKNGERWNACKAISKGILKKPFRFSYWKTLLGSLIFTR
ncbi:MAG: hypothetical protein COA78_36840 [Blastopirellula sp.]|nr:MAG: hypothetical protein COA78_36840 [Blastopirellula sp.]